MVGTMGWISEKENNNNVKFKQIDALIMHRQRQAMKNLL